MRRGYHNGHGSRVWIDYNQDGDFDDSGETAATFDNHGTVEQSASFTVPSAAVTGTTRMRVYTDMSEEQGHITPEPCGYLYDLDHYLMQHGEVEDYDVAIAP